MPTPPVREDSFDKINFVIDSWTTGCDAPWYIYIETMKPAAIEAFFALLAFGTGDVARGIFRPKGLGRRTGKRKGKWARRIPHFPEIGNTIGREIGVMTGATDYTRWRAGALTLWRIDLAMQSALLLWLVADIAEDFVFNWTSLLYESYWCQPDPPGRFSWTHAGMSTSNGGVWQIWRYPTRDYQTSPPNWANTIGWTGPKGATVMASITVKRLLPFDQPGNVAVRVTNAGGTEVYGETSATEPDENGEFRLPVIARLGDNTVFEVRVFHDAPWAQVGDGAVVAVGNR